MHKIRYDFKRKKQSCFVEGITILAGHKTVVGFKPWTMTIVIIKQRLFKDIYQYVKSLVESSNSPTLQNQLIIFAPIKNT